MKRVLIVGATSAIAGEVVRHYAEAGSALYLLGRNPSKLEEVSEFAISAGAVRVGSSTYDITDLSRHRALLDDAIASLGGIDRVLIAHGSLPDQDECERRVDAALDCLQVNLIGTISLLTLLANEFESRRGGCIAVIGSVAGERGRQSNYVYGTAKGALEVFLQGLRNRLHVADVRVLTVKPGFVDTPMTSHLTKTALFSTPVIVGRAIYDGMEKGKDVLYVPWFWKWIMGGIRSVPESAFKRLKL